VRDGVAGLAGEFHAAHGDEADGEAVHAVTDVGARAVGAEHLAGEVVVARARAAALSGRQFVVETQVSEDSNLAFCQQLQSLRIKVTAEEPVDRALEYWPVRRNSPEQRHAGMEFQIVRVSKDFMSRFSLDSEHGLGAIEQPDAKHGMVQVSRCFAGTLDRVESCRLAAAESVQLWENKPYPMASFLTRTNLAECLLIHGRLSIHEALEKMGIVGHLVVS